MKFLVSIFGLVLLSASVSATPGIPEHLMGFYTSPKGIHFQVWSGGCTDKIDFYLYKKETFPVQLSLVRAKHDMCEGYLPYGTVITYSWKELGLRPSDFTLENPVQ